MLAQEVKIESIHGYDIFHSLEGGAVLHRAPQLGDGLASVGPSVSLLKEALSHSTFYIICSTESFSGGLPSGIRDFIEDS